MTINWSEVYKDSEYRKIKGIFIFSSQRKY